MKRYVNVVKDALIYKSFEDAKKNRQLKTSKPARILSADEEKEFAWGWWKIAIKEIVGYDRDDKDRQKFEKEWKEVENGKVI